MDIDEVYAEIGEFGSFQMKVFWATGLLGIFFAFHMVHLVFIGAPPVDVVRAINRLLRFCRMDIDEVYKRKIGGFGPHQARLFWAFALLHLLIPLHNFQIVFIGTAPLEVVNIIDFLFKQECIPVGYVLPARYRTGGLCPGGSP